MHEFAGYNMPIEYSGILDEHHTVCQSVGVFDVSHMGEFWVKGPHALEFIQQVTSNNAAVLTLGKVQYTCFPNETGGIVDDLLVYFYEPDKYMLVVNAANIEKDWNWCVAHNTVGAELEIHPTVLLSWLFRDQRLLILYRNSLLLIFRKYLIIPSV